MCQSCKSFPLFTFNDDDRRCVFDFVVIVFLVAFIYATFVCCARGRETTKVGEGRGARSGGAEGGQFSGGSRSAQGAVVVVVVVVGVVAGLGVGLGVGVGVGHHMIYNFHSVLHCIALEVA